MLHKEICLNLFNVEGLFSLGIKAKKDELVAPPILSFFLVQFNIFFRSSLIIFQATPLKLIVKPSGPGALSAWSDQIALLISCSKMGFANSLFSTSEMINGIPWSKSCCDSESVSPVSAKSS